MADKLSYDGPVDLVQYFVKGVNMTDNAARVEKLTRTKRGIRVDIVFSRRILNQILTTFLPTVFICAVAFATNYFKADYFESVVTVNVTIWLVLTTLYIGIINSLPRTAYIKLIDVWLITNMLVPFLEVMLHTFMDHARNRLIDDDEDQLASDAKGAEAMKRHLRRAERATKVYLPLLYVTFCVGFFVFSFAHQSFVNLSVKPLD